MTKIFIFDSATRNFLPTDIGVSLAFWFSAKDTSSIILSGSNVQEWRDKSGYNRHISAPAATNQPLWVPSATDGLPLLRFDGVDDILQNTSMGTAGLNNVSILAIFRFVSASGEDIPVGFGASTSSGNLRAFWRPNGSTAIAFAGYYRDVFSNYSADIGGNFHLFEMWNTALSGVNHLFLGRDGINNSYTPTNGGVLIATSNGFAVGSWVGNAPAYTVYASNIEVREVLAFSTNLSTANLQKAEGYLMHEWNMANLLPADHPFKNRRPFVTD